MGDNGHYGQSAAYYYGYNQQQPSTNWVGQNQQSLVLPTTQVIEHSK